MRPKSISPAALLAAVALGLSAAGASAQLIIRPDQFIFSTWTWDGNLLESTFEGDLYPYTPNYGNTPSATVLIPLGSSLPAGWNLYNIYELIPDANSESYNVLWIAADGTLNNPQPGLPWSGQYGSNVQYLQIPQNDQGAWVGLGPGPQSDPTQDGGYAVWINGSANPFLEIKYPGLSFGPESFDSFMVVAVPEPSVLTLGLLGGCTLLAGVSRRLRLHI